MKNEEKRMKNEERRMRRRMNKLDIYKKERIG